jgi:hypothetical protein
MVENHAWRTVERLRHGRRGDQAEFLPAEGVVPVNGGSWRLQCAQAGRGLAPLKRKQHRRERGVAQQRKGLDVVRALFILVEQGNESPVMTHNLPRWASHGAFDFQFKGDRTLIGVFERVRGAVGVDLAIPLALQDRGVLIAYNADSSSSHSGA